MKRALFLFVVLLATACGAGRSGRRDSGAVTDGDEDSIIILERLSRAEAYYEKGILELREGRIGNGRAEIRRAFSLLTSQFDSDGLPAALKNDFLSMLEQARVWEGDEKITESSLDVSEDKLRNVPPAQTRGVIKSHAVPIDPKNETTRKFIQIYTTSRKKSVEEALGRSGKYRTMMTEALREAGLPEELFYLVMTESEYKQQAISRSGAGGLWQFMPGTARAYGLEVSFWVDERYNPEKATRAAIQYLTQLFNWFGDWHLALAAYNRGEHGIGRDLRNSRALDFGTLSKRGVLPGETNNYVPKYMACVLIGESPENYGLHPRYEKPTPFEVVEIERPLDLKIAAQAAKTTEEVIREFNPELRAWATPKNRKDYPLRIPKGIKSEFLARLKEVKDWNPGPEFVKHKVLQGEYLGKIANRYKTTVKSITSLNQVKDPRLIRPGTILKVRPGRGYNQEVEKKEKKDQEKGGKKTKRS